MNTDRIIELLEAEVANWDLVSETLRDKVFAADHMVVDSFVLDNMARHAGFTYLVGQASAILGRIYDPEDDINTEAVFEEWRKQITRELLRVSMPNSSSSSRNLIEGYGIEAKARFASILGGAAW